MNLQAQLEILKQQAAQSMMFADSPSSENPNSYYADTAKTPSIYHHDHHQEHQNIYHHHADQTHLVYQSGSSGMVHLGDATGDSYHTENPSGGFSSYSNLEQHLNTFNQDHLKELQPGAFGFISFS